jgi:hypothetical protein
MMMLRTIVVLAGILVGVSFANAIQIPPECKGFPDQIGCACALQNGGFIEERNVATGGRHWWSKHSKTGPANEAFVNCNKRERGIK